MKEIFTAWLMMVTLVVFLDSAGQQPRRTRPLRTTTNQPTPEARPPDPDLEIAARFAPIIHQGLDGNPRFDYITSFNFDDDWHGDNNWENAENRSHPLRAYVYYSVIETDTHYFIHYATFHPRDYKGGLFQSWLLAEAMRQAKERLKDNLPEGAEDLTLSHENDLEGCLVVAEKRGRTRDEAKVVYVETMAHNEFHKYRPLDEPITIGYEIELDGSHPVLFSEPKGHGLLAYTGRPNQLKDATQGVVIYHYTGQSEDPEQVTNKRVRYRLIPIYATLWQHAQTNAEQTYGEMSDYGTRTVSVLDKGAAAQKQISIGRIGSAFRGVVGAENKARPPWAWFDYRERNQPRGEWFFDPAATIKRHFYAYSLSTVYVHNPYLEIWREAR
jgi:hypothetical protein